MAQTTTKKDQGQEAADKLHQAASHAGHAVQDAASTVGHKAQDAAHAVTDKARDMASTVGHKAEDATASVGSGMQSLADKVRDKAPNEGMLGKASESVASALEHGGKYLEDKNLSGLADDMAQMIKRNPLPAVLIGVGLGFLLGRTLRS